MLLLHAGVAGTGLDDRSKLELISLVDDYVFGFVYREAAGRSEVPEHADLETLIDQIPDTMLEYFEELVASGDYPHAGALADGSARGAIRLFASVLFEEQRFERGLERLLDGVALRLEDRAGS